MKIVIVGGGAGGLELATRLGRAYRKHQDIEVDLVDRTHSHLWKPLLHEVAAGTLNPNEDELSYLAHAHWNGYRFHLGALEGIDREQRTITIGASYDNEGREYVPARKLSYDTLVLAIGSVTNDFGIEGVADHCLFLDHREQADAFHQNLVRSCYAANSREETELPNQLNVAIAGAGATGVELAAELHHAIRMLVSFGLDQIDPASDLRIHLLEGADRILPGLPERVSKSTHRVLEDLEIAVHTSEFVTKATAEGFHTQSGKFIPAEIKVWAAGIRGAELLGGLGGLESTALNQLRVKPTLQTTRDDSIYAFGDCAACPMGDDGTLVPPRAQAAHQQAALIARSIECARQGKELPTYRYKDFGSLINLSEHSAVGNLMGNLLRGRTTSVPIEGRLARWAYLSLYKMHQLAVQGVIRTTLTTAADFLTRASKPRLKMH